MDVQKWLNETVLPNPPPSLPDGRNVPRLLHSKKHEQPPTKKRRHRLGTPDSSLLEASEQRKKPVPVERNTANRNSADESAGSDASHPTWRSGSSTSSNSYARKPRRKTRPERYEPALQDVKQRDTHAHRHRKDESRRTRRKTRRRKVDKQATGIVQHFHAKNVPKERLTLKPQEKLGLFNKGRASSPVKGRGLPDLVFSEMKFLQKHQNQPEADTEPGLSKKKRKKDQAHAKEQEISAYFTSVRPALAKKDVNIQAKEVSHHRELQEIDRSKQERMSIIDNAIPTIEVTDKASYLGFGGRGPRHESGSYISWSESIREPSVTPAHRRIGSAAGNGQLNSVHDRQGAGSTDGGEVLHSRPAPPPVARQITDDSAERFQFSSLAPANERISRSHSYPPHTSSPQRLNLVDRAAKHQTLERVPSPSSLSPFKPASRDTRIPQRKCTAESSISRGASSSAQKPGDAPSGNCSPKPRTADGLTEEANMQTSSSLERILQECNSAFHTERQPASYDMDEQQTEGPDQPRQGSLRNHCRPYLTIQNIPTVRFTGIEEIRPQRVPDLAGSSIYERQRQRQTLAQELELCEDDILCEPHALDGEYYDREEVDQDVQYEQERLDPTLFQEDLMVSREELLGPSLLDEIEVSPKIWRNSVTNASFWRPHRLY